MFYWRVALISLHRRPPQPTPPGRPRLKLPLLGGTLTISIVQTKGPAQTGPGPARTSQQRVLARLQQKSRLGSGHPSDEVEGLKFVVHWEPAKGALGVLIPQEESILSPDALQVVRLFLRGLSSLTLISLIPL